VDANWDIDDGTGTGTPNWKGSASGSALRYLQAPIRRRQRDLR
jgi:hypothetical protein